MGHLASKSKNNCRNKGRNKVNYPTSAERRQKWGTRLCWSTSLWNISVVRRRSGVFRFAQDDTFKNKNNDRDKNRSKVNYPTSAKRRQKWGTLVFLLALVFLPGLEFIYR